MGYRILYIAKHGSGGNDDEGAIAHALTSLGHTVLPLREDRGHNADRLGPADIVLFHKYDNTAVLERFARKAVRVFWYFDLVDYPDPTLAARNATRVAWMQRVTPHVDMGFCTDGDWCAADTTGKLHWLPQGADERVAGVGDPRKCPTCDREWQGAPILFTGIRNGGTQRQSFVDEMQAKYGPRFRHVATGVHGRKLADLIAGSQIVVAPDGPVTDRYWSNRVYLSLGFGAFLLHPYCRFLQEHYHDRQEIVYYHDRAQLFNLIDSYLEFPADRRRIAEAGLRRTLTEHTYRHRVANLLDTVRERLGVGQVHQSAKH